MVTATITEYYDGHDLVVVEKDYFGMLEGIIGLDDFQNNQIALNVYGMKMVLNVGQRLKMVDYFKFGKIVIWIWKEPLFYKTSKTSFLC